MIDRIVLYLTDKVTGWLFSTAAITDPRIRPVCSAAAGGPCDEGSIRRELTPSSLLLDCRPFDAGSSDARICVSVGRGWSRQCRDMLDASVRAFPERGYKVARNGPLSNPYAPGMEPGYLSLMIEVDKGTFLMPNDDLDMEKAGRLQGAIAAFYTSVLDNQANITETYRRYFPLFHACRERIWSEPRFFSAPIPQYFLNVKTPASLGAYLKAVETRPDLFRTGEGHVICQYWGSPMSGATTNVVINLRTGKTREWSGGGYHAKSIAWRDELKAYPVRKESALPLAVIAEMLQDGR